MELYQKADLSLFERSSHDRLFEFSKDAGLEDDALAFNAQRSAQDTHSDVSTIMSGEDPVTNRLRDDGGMARTFGSLYGEKSIVSGDKYGSSAPKRSRKPQARVSPSVHSASFRYRRVGNVGRHLRSTQSIERPIVSGMASDEDSTTNGERDYIQSVQLSSIQPFDDLDPEENMIPAVPLSSVHRLSDFEFPPLPRQQGFMPRQMVTINRLEDTGDPLLPQRKTTRLHSESQRSALLAKGNSIFINHTISEDRSGDQESVIGMRLAALRIRDARALAADVTEPVLTLDDIESLLNGSPEEIAVKEAAERRSQALRPSAFPSNSSAQERASTLPQRQFGPLLARETTARRRRNRDRDRDWDKYRDEQPREKLYGEMGPGYIRINVMNSSNYIGEDGVSSPREILPEDAILESRESDESPLFPDSGLPPRSRRSDTMPVFVGDYQSAPDVVESTDDEADLSDAESFMLKDKHDTTNTASVYSIWRSSFDNIISRKNAEERTQQSKELWR